MLAGVGGWRKCFTIFHEMEKCWGHDDLTTCRWIALRFPLDCSYVSVGFSNDGGRGWLAKTLYHFP